MFQYLIPNNWKEKYHILYKVLTYHIEKSFIFLDKFIWYITEPELETGNLVHCPNYLIAIKIWIYCNSR